MNLFHFRLIVLFLAIIFDLMGEVPEKIHPVVWIGKIIGFFEKKVNSYRKILGVISSSVTIIIFVLPLFLFSNTILLLIPSAFIVSTMFSLNTLLKMVKETDVGDIKEKREKTQKLVSRDTSNLSKESLNSASIETAAENFTDSVIGPIFYFVLFGLPGIVLYRVVNTMDGMVGYKNERFKDFGWFAARLDDVLNFIPSRVASILLVIANRKFEAFKVIKENRKIKLNPGWTLSAISGILDRRIKKQGYYDINKNASFPKNIDIQRCLSVIKRAFVLFILIVFILMSVGGFYIST